MVSPSFYQKRLQDLQDNIDKDLELRKKFEEALRYEDDPRRISRYEREIERQRESITCYQQEFDELQQKLTGERSAQLQQMESQLQQMEAKLDILLSVQVQMREALLNRYDAAQQAIVGAIEQLDQTQLVLTQKLLDALEANLVSELEMQQMLTVLEERIPSLHLPPSQEAITEIIKAPELDAKHKLKFTLPIVPTLVEYESELELGSGLNLKSAWEQLVAKLRRN